MTISADDTPFQRRLLREIEAAKRKAAAQMMGRLWRLSSRVTNLAGRVNRAERAAKQRREMVNELLDAMEKLMTNPHEPEVQIEARRIYRKFRP